MDRYPGRGRLVLATAILSLALAACGGAGASSAPSSETSPSSAPASQAEASASAAPLPGTDLTACEIITAEDVASALQGLGAEGVEVAEGELTEEGTVLDPAATGCRYEGDWGGVVIDLTPTDGANLYDAARGSYDDASDVEIAGADSAFWSAGTNRGFFWKGAVNTMVQFSHLTVEVDREAATVALGEAAISKL